MAAPYRSAQKLRRDNCLSEITNNASLKATALANLGLTGASVGSNYTTTATAAGTTTLVATSTSEQFFTGTTTQNVVMPVVSTLKAGQQFSIYNASTGAVTVKSSGANTITVLAGSTAAVFTAVKVDTTTDATAWNSEYLGELITSAKLLTVTNSLTLSGTDSTTMTFPSTSATIARTDAGNTFTGNQIVTGTVTVADATTPSLSTASGKTNTGNLTVSGKTSGSLIITTADATAQALTLSAAAQTVGAATITIPDVASVSDTVALLTKSQSLASKTLVTPVISTGLTASGSASNDFSASTGTFKTSTGLVTIGGSATLPAGQAGAGLAPLYFTSGSNLSAAAAGAVEYDGTSSYLTNETTSGRGLIPTEQFFMLTADGGTISTIANFYGATSNLSLVSGAYYDIELFMWFVNSADTNTVNWTLTNTAAPTSQNIYFSMSPTAGIVAPPGTATELDGEFLNDNTAAKSWASGALTSAASYFSYIRIWLKNGTGTSLKFQMTKNTGGTALPKAGSYWRATRLPATNVGNFAA